MHCGSFVTFVGFVALATGCASGPSQGATRIRTFYDFGISDRDDSGEHKFERAAPELDGTSNDGAWRGVAVLDGDVRLSRPATWQLRSASAATRDRFIQYVSPRQYMFSIYERRDAPGDSWDDIDARYEGELKSAGVELVSKAVPMSVGNAPARAYALRAHHASGSGEIVNDVHEYLVRGSRSVLLIQLLSTSDGSAIRESEALRALASIRID